MKQSLRAHRMERYHKRSLKPGKLSLVSLMDIFTILVFFLLVNSSEVEVLQTQKDISLPESIADQKPDGSLVVMANSESILVNGRHVANTADVMASDEAKIEPLMLELRDRAARKPFVSEKAKRKGHDITIMGDQNITYSLLKKIMVTCAATDYRNISLAVSQVPNKDIEELARAATTSEAEG